VAWSWLYAPVVQPLEYATSATHQVTSSQPDISMDMSALALVSLYCACYVCHKGNP